MRNHISVNDTFMGISISLLFIYFVCLLTFCLILLIIIGLGVGCWNYLMLALLQTLEEA